MFFKIDNNIYSIFLVFLILMSCDKAKVIKEYYPDGTKKTISKYSQDESLDNIEYYDSLGKLTKRVYYTKGIIDSLIGFKGEKSIRYKKRIFSNNILQITYHENGKVESEGFILKDTLKTDWWSYYDTIGKVKSKREYILLCDDYYLNQSVIFNKQMDTVYGKGDFNESITLTLHIKETNGTEELHYNIRPISDRSILEMVFLKSNNFCEEEKNIDTIIPLKTRNGKLVLDKKRSSYTGFIFDYYIDTSYVDGKMKRNAISRKIYFDKTRSRLRGN